MYLELMNAGRALIAGSLNSSNKPRIASFDVGSQAGFIPDKNGLGVLPSIIYTGTIASIRKTIISNDELILTVAMPNEIVIPKFGNIMLRTNSGVPFLWFVLKDQFGKLSIDNEKHYAGDMHFQSMVLKIPQIVNRLDLSQNPNFYANPEYYDDFEDLPEPILCPTTEAVIKNADYKYNYDLPIHAFRVKGQWWGTPNMQSLDDNDIGSMDGGTVGDGYGDVNG